jgi:hypothetical protein
MFVTTLFSAPATLPKPKHSMLPVLVVLFLVSYGLITLLIVEQGRTIQAQRVLIHQLIGDTSELAAMKGKAIREQALSRQAQPKAQEQSPAPQARAEKSRPSANNKAQRTAPVKPPKPASDMVDVRRNLLSI